MTILRIALPGPLRRALDYLPPPGVDPERLQPGMRLALPLGRRQTVGILVDKAARSELPRDRLRHADAVLDSEPALTGEILALARWASGYYHHPLGDCLLQALPGALRRAHSLWAEETWWAHTERALGLAEAALRRAPRQQQALTALLARPHRELELRRLGIARPSLLALAERGLARHWQEPTPPLPPTATDAPEPAPELHPEQRSALSALTPGRFQCALLDGITGSGKTEVYLEAARQVLAQGQQVLVLVPEIGLTPQLLERFRRRLAVPVASLHSGLSEGERLTAWRQARAGAAQVLIGTRSAVFAPLPQLGLIIVDEEHDASLKQQEGFRYHARDLAIKRAADRGCPILLGSATPSLESLAHAHAGRYHHLRLTQRAGGAKPPRMRLLDLRGVPVEGGLAAPSFKALQHCLDRGDQALVFLNRRGFAPVLLCRDCGWVAECNHCDARLTVHIGLRRLICHHCGDQHRLPGHCPTCQGSQLQHQGPGTEQLEQVLTREFPRHRVLRIDRDTTRRRHALSELVSEIHQGQPALLIGTQMLAKGHHFPAVTLVVVVDADGGLLSADFRGSERTAQLLLQVAGRAGRAERSGEVLIQTHHPDHPLLQRLLEEGYESFARQLLEARQQQGLPPHGHLALVRADSRQPATAEQFLLDLRQRSATAGVTLLGPLPAPMARRAGRHRSQLLLAAPRRGPLHQALAQLADQAEQHPLASRLRWSIDVDPQETG